MLGNMMNSPLLISTLLTHAERHHGDQQVVSRRVEGDIHRYSYRDMAARCRKLAKALAGLGMQPADRIATLAWNGYRHLELYYAISGSGAIVHTINPRLHPEQVSWIVNHAQDKILFCDLTFLPLIEDIAQQTDTVQAFVVMTDRENMPVATSVPNLLCYEDLVDAADAAFDWPQFDENTASSLCYTSGTTGNPKGVLYSHRSTVLHSFGAALPDSMNCAATDNILPAVPMFHVNAWGLPYIGCMVGAKLVFPGPMLDGKSLHDLIEAEGVTFSAGVPTIWQGLLAHMESIGGSFATMRRTVIGGSACPPSIIRAYQDRYDVAVLHAWGMTETSPVGTVNTPKPVHAGLPPEDRLALQAKQGRVVFGVDMKIVDENGDALPHDGKTPGDLLVRGPWIMARYFNAADDGTLWDGWFPTGDIATIDADGFMQITDRSKDVIKSGGEWIGSIDLENIATGHPDIAQAACIAARHDKWGERPLLVAVRKPGAQVSTQDILAHFNGKIAKWWTPDDVVFVDEIPIGATGKVLKNRLRERFDTHLLAKSGSSGGPR
ncbi:3-(methylthio)propionyl-CoA ligase [Thalassovita sp.]|uniref:3-(methylthio)propionyl-CoA ligase n=1 Tax=Thalassovita sp. TaxID=1979401 RepID=UPI0029DE821A|nr:3-(methylthio)propionyl-CoA ligase [Thalassovita sp.]